MCLLLVYQFNNNCIIILHSTGRIKTIYINKIAKLFPNKKIFIFMHVSIAYEIHKDRMSFIDNLHNVCCQNDIVILTPSPEVTLQYRNNGFIAQSVQIGIDNKLDEFYYKRVKRLEKYYNKIVTTCVCDNKGYYTAKGIDVYSEMIKENNWNQHALIAGIKESKDSLLCHKFSEKDFLNVLCHSKLYVQFSMFESYNVTAIYAKRFKIPTLLMSAEGNITCMNGNVYNSYEQMVRDIKKILNGVRYNKLDENYNDSIIRETLYKFNMDFQKLGGN